MKTTTLTPTNPIITTPKYTNKKLFLTIFPTQQIPIVHSYQNNIITHSSFILTSTHTQSIRAPP